MSGNKKSRYKEPLNELDTPDLTFGCRHTNPDNCRNNLLPNVCAFVRDDFICQAPPMTWKRQYEKLLKQDDASKED